MAANLAVALSTSWKNVVLLDADLRCPSLHNYFDLDNKVGLSNFPKDPNPGVTQIIQETPYQRLKIVPGGPPPTNPLELLSSPRHAMAHRSHEGNCRRGAGGYSAFAGGDR